jgi:phosphoenolpyruvate-protein phosphotransferase (PTS system enzyme I)
MRTIRGVSASRGIATGPAFQFHKTDLEFDRCTITDCNAELDRFQRAVTQAKSELGEIQAKAEAESGAEEAAVFEAHVMMLEDPELLDSIRKAIESDHQNAETALTDTSEMYAQMLEALDDEYLSARAADIRDVSKRVLRILCGVDDSPTEHLTVPSIILAEDLTPSDTVMLDKSLVLGFCTAAGGATSHTAILARGLALPAVVGAGKAILDAADGTTLIVDGDAGTLLIEPDTETVVACQMAQDKNQTLLAEARKLAHEPATTEDGHTVEVVSNVSNVELAQAALRDGAEGVGLLRSEFVYLERESLPDEEEQFQAYRSILEVFGDLPVILRTLDIGGDKKLPYLPLANEMNPFLGLRAIRLCLARPELFRPQLRAALRAGHGHNLKLMFPMVATVKEIRAGRAILEECRRELESEGTPIADHIEIGIMIEIPAAAITADLLAQEVDFFSIGTNDLCQYTMAADRTNADVSDLADAFHPAVLRMVQLVINAAHAQGKWVGMCGEMAGEPLAVPVLLGLGLDEFSMNPPAIPIAKQIIRSLITSEAEELALATLDARSPEEVKALVRERVPAADL